MGDFILHKSYITRDAIFKKPVKTMSVHAEKSMLIKKKMNSTQKRY